MRLGAINTWDRQAYMTTIATGAPSYVPAETEINNNFIVSNGDADGGAIDNDDGSSHYNEHHNFCVCKFKPAPIAPSFLVDLDEAPTEHV